MEAHAALMRQGLPEKEATRRLDMLMRVARSWGLMRVATFLKVEIEDGRRMKLDEARRICGWRNA